MEKMKQGISLGFFFDMSVLHNAFCLFVIIAILPSVSTRSAANTLLSVCERRWELVYSHDEYGNATFGSKKELRELAMTGNYIKANLYMPDHILQLPADSLSKNGEELCFQSLRVLATNGTHLNETDPWLYFLVCTTGHVTEKDVNNMTIFRVAMDWYVKDISSDSEPVYSNFVDGTPSSPAGLVKLHNAATRMALFGSMRDRPYVFPFHNVFVDPQTGEVNGQNVFHLGQRFQDDHITFLEQPKYKWYSFWSILGKRDNARWSLQGHDAYNHNADNCAIDWFADVCWRLVYVHDSYGFEEFGVVQDLIGAIQRGHRVRVRVGDVTMEASNIRINEGVVAAQLLHEVSKVGGTARDKYFIDADTKVRFSIVHTTGKVNSYEYLVGSPVKKINPPKREKVEWMVDTRPWNVVLKTVDPPGEIVNGSVFDLRKAVMGGASIRLNIELDPLAGSFYTQANNLQAQVLTDTIFAQALDHISDKKSRVPKEYELQNTIFNWYLIVSSGGGVDMSGWMYGLDTRMYERRAAEAKVTWYANL